MRSAGRWLLLAVALLVLCVLIAVQMIHESESPPPHLDRNATPEGDGEAPLVQLKGRVRDGDDATGTLVGGGDDPSVVEAGVGELTELRGRVVVRDAEGGRHAEASGTFKLQVRHRKGSQEALVQVEQGAWRIRAPPALGLRVSDLRLGGRMACATWEEIAVVPGKEVVLDCWWPRSSILHVRDHETGKQLLDLLLVQAGRFDDRRDNPSDGWKGRVAGEGLASPITLPDRDGIPSWYVRAPGYAWGRVAVDQRSGGTHHVALEPGGDLEVRFTGAMPPKDAWLIVTWLYLDEHPITAAEFRLNRHTPIVVDGLPPQVCGLEVRQGYRGKSLVIGIAEVRVGTRQAMTLELEGSAEATRVPLAGVVRFREGPAPTSTSLWLSNDEAEDGRKVVYLTSEQLSADPQEPRVLRWNAGAVVPGTWRVRVLPFGVARELTVGVRGLEKAIVDMPELCELRVDIRERPSGERVEMVDVGFVREQTARKEEGRLTWSNELARWIGRVPIGPVSVIAEGPLHRMGEHDAVLDSGVNEIRLDLRPAEVVMLDFRDGDAVLPIDNAPYMVLVDEDGTQHANRRYDRERQRMLVYPPGPGRYRLVFEVGEEYEPVRDVRLEFAPQQQIERTIRLRRKR